MSNQENLSVVNRLFKAIENRDEDGFRSFFTDSSTFKNGPHELVIGTDAIWKEFAEVLAISEAVEWIVPNIAVAANGNVLAERADRFFVNNQWMVFRVVGVFEVEGGKISHWREYLDMQEAMTEVARCGVQLGGDAE